MSNIKDATLVSTFLGQHALRPRIMPPYTYLDLRGKAYWVQRESRVLRTQRIRFSRAIDAAKRAVPLDDRPALRIVCLPLKLAL